MKNIEVIVLNEAHDKPANMMMFLAKLTQSGHKIKSGGDLVDFYNECMDKTFKSAGAVAQMPHGTIHRFAPITIAIVGGSRRLLAQLRTHHIGIEWVSASLQYSDYSHDAQFVVPYELTQKDAEYNTKAYSEAYLMKCKQDAKFYRDMIADGLNNDTAGYAMNQGMRNILVATASIEAWRNLIKVRSCRRNTNETAYVATLIWDKLFSETTDGDIMFKYAGPDCLHGKCQEGHMCCGKPLGKAIRESEEPAKSYLKTDWPLLVEEVLV